MEQQPKLASVHVLKTRALRDDLDRAERLHEVVSSGSALRQVLKAVVGRMKWHDTIVDNPYGYKQQDPAPHFLAHAELGNFAAQVEEILNAAGWDTTDVRAEMVQVSPTLWNCYQLHEAGKPITGRDKPPVPVAQICECRKCQVRRQPPAARQPKDLADTETAADRRRRIAREQREARQAKTEARQQARAAKKAAKASGSPPPAPTATPRPPSP